LDTPSYIGPMTVLQIRQEEGCFDSESKREGGRGG